MDHGHVFLSFLILYIHYGPRPRTFAHTETPAIDPTVTPPLLHRPTTLLRRDLEPTGAPVRRIAG